TITTADWLKLGVSEKTAITIDKYRLKGGKFRRAEDILRIYGLSENDKKRLLPFVRIIGNDQRSAHASKSNSKWQNIGRFEDSIQSLNNFTSSNSDRFANNNDAPHFTTPKFKKKIPQVIDINSADTSDWSKLPGIGPVLSQRIIKYRDRLGGFYSVLQVAEVYGLPDSVFNKIRPYLTKVAGVRKINVNEVTPDILEQHPYMKRHQARAIVDYRVQHGIFKELEDLKQVVSITPELFDRIYHYLGL
ncbi:MAG: hypothetical protein EOO04_22315, partial [Chitinophagaceae bacterium]